MGANKKIGLAIVTYTINYGTYLQAFATQYAIRKLGFDTEIININSVIGDVSKARKKYFLRQLFNFAEVKSYLGIIGSIIQKKINPSFRKYYAQRENAFARFNKEYFHFGPICDSWKGLSEYCRKFDSVVVGSDQLWRPANIAGNFYTLNFVPEEINKVAYATSFGLSEIRQNQKGIATAFLKRIQHLSCREESGAKIIKELTKRDAKVVCDPTLLVTKDDWNSLIPQNKIIQGDYILAYLVGNKKEHREYIRNLAKKMSCKIVGVLHGAGYVKGDEKFVDEYPADIGPFEFLNLIKNAKCVCTDSFHGCVFSIIFKKNLHVFKRFSDSDKMSTNSRVTNLLRRLQLDERLVEDYSKYNLNGIDYSSVEKLLDSFRNESKNYLINALNAE
ncbi:polysaccharide pyruvyl transferase family protein [uncultured Fibrobacter sp.]|uniref:polysaccharide pyruvyl transferase family protein n=1 Tax=uncultured Fibrobacter sp. TaxID=261512 RepID=UPI0025FA27D4|nr:polysaccharide pyruvyl transferase family protein [uncultured Fibrobacter sp.]